MNKIHRAVKKKKYLDFNLNEFAYDYKNPFAV